MDRNDVVIRPLRADDIAALVEFERTRSEPASFDASIKEASLRMILSLPGFDPSEDARIAEAGGRVVGWARLGADEAWANIALDVDPGASGRAAERLLLAWGLGRAKVTNGVCGARAFADGNAESSIRDLESLGFEHVRSTLTMTLRSPGSAGSPVWPSGIEVRCLDGDAALDAVVEAHDRAFAADPDFEAADRDSWRRHMARSGVGLWIFAFGGATVAGFCIADVADSSGVRRGTIGPLGTVPAFRRVGLGRALLREGLGRLASHGCEEAQLIVNSANENDASRLYRSEGFEVTRDWRVYEIPLG